MRVELHGDAAYSRGGLVTFWSLKK